MAIPETFRAAFIDSPGSPATIRSRSHTSPVAPNEVGIKITATAINPVDWKLRDSGLFLPTWPTIMGSDAAGEIVEIGSDATDRFSVGDRVFFQGVVGNLDACTFQEYTRIDARLVGKTPANITDEEAAGISLCGVTAVIGLYHKTGRNLSPAPWDTDGRKLGSGKAIVVLGGSTSVGQYVIQLARLSGYSRIVTNAGASNADMLKKLGAHVVLDRKIQTSVQDFLDAVGGQDVELDVVYDCVEVDHAQRLGVQIIQAAPKSTRDAIVVSVAQPGEEAVEEGKGSDGQRQVDVKGIFAAAYWPEYRHISEPMYPKFSEWLASGELVPNRVEVVPGGLGAVEEAMLKNKAGVSGVKLVVRPHGVP